MYVLSPQPLFTGAYAKAPHELPPDDNPSSPLFDSGAQEGDADDDEVAMSDRGSVSSRGSVPDDKDLDRFAGNGSITATTVTAAPAASSISSTSSSGPLAHPTPPLLGPSSSSAGTAASEASSQRMGSTGRRRDAKTPLVMLPSMATVVKRAALEPEPRQMSTSTTSGPLTPKI
jgi:hypothetical protein